MGTDNASSGLTLTETTKDLSISVGNRSWAATERLVDGNGASGRLEVKVEVTDVHRVLTYGNIGDTFAPATESVVNATTYDPNTGDVTFVITYTNCKKNAETVDTRDPPDRENNGVCCFYDGYANETHPATYRKIVNGTETYTARNATSHETRFTLAVTVSGDGIANATVSQSVTLSSLEGSVWTGAKKSGTLDLSARVSDADATLASDLANKYRLVTTNETSDDAMLIPADAFVGSSGDAALNKLGITYSMFNAQDNATLCGNFSHQPEAGEVLRVKGGDGSNQFSEFQANPLYGLPKGCWFNRDGGGVCPNGTCTNVTLFCGFNGTISLNVTISNMTSVTSAPVQVPTPTATATPTETATQPPTATTTTPGSLGDSHATTDSPPPLPPSQATTTTQGPNLRVPTPAPFPPTLPPDVGVSLVPPTPAPPTVEGAASLRGLTLSEFTAPETGLGRAFEQHLGEALGAERVGVSCACPESCGTRQGVDLLGAECGLNGTDSSPALRVLGAAGNASGDPPLEVRYAASFASDALAGEARALLNDPDVYDAYAAHVLNTTGVALEITTVYVCGSPMSALSGLERSNSSFGNDVSNPALLLGFVLAAVVALCSFLGAFHSKWMMVPAAAAANVRNAPRGAGDGASDDDDGESGSHAKEKEEEEEEEEEEREAQAKPHAGGEGVTPDLVTVEVDEAAFFGRALT